VDNAPADENPSAASAAGGPPKTTETLQGQVVPVNCGPAHRLRPDIAAALIWGPRGNWALAADRLIRLIGDAELVLVITPAWLSPQGWGLMSVTSDRVLYVPVAESEDMFAQPIPSLLWLIDGDKTNDHGDRKASIVDLERNIVVWFESSASVEAVNAAIRRAVRLHTDAQPGYEAAQPGNLLDEFSRFFALHRAHETGVLDNDALRSALWRLFGVALTQPPPPSPPYQQPPSSL
jgi:hypothetical protein